MWTIFKTKMLIYQSKANLDEKILFGRINDHLNPEMRKMLLGRTLENRNSTFHCGLLFTCY